MKAFCEYLLAILASSCFVLAARSQASFGGVVFLGGFWDLRPGVDGALAPSRCESAVERAAEIGITKLSFLPTVYWSDTGPAEPPAGFDPLCEGFGSDLSGYYCYDRFNTTSVSHFCLTRTPEDVITHTCEEPTAEAIRVWQLLLGQCLSKAAELGMSVEVNLRVDDGRTLNGWRNTVLFSPTKVYGNYSYETAFLQPLVEIMSSIPYQGELALTVAGEMGASTVFHSADWIEVMGRAREQLDASRPSGSPPVKVGVQLNANKLCGCFNVGFVGSYEEFIRSFEDDFDPVAMGIDVDAFIELLESSDYVGVSAYAAVEDPEAIAPCEFENLLRRFDDELKFFSTSVANITRSGTKLQLSETGVGGGASQDGKKPAPDSVFAAQRPYWGVQGPPKEDGSNDPFEMHLCDDAGICSNTNPIRDYRRQFYREFSKYLLGVQGNCTYDRAISEVYLWATGSFDVLELYPPDAGYGDPVVVETLVRHNNITASNTLSAGD